MSEPVVMCWSGGKDSALSLHVLQQAGVEVVSLLTTLTDEYDRISMHGVRRELLEAQAKSLGIPLSIVRITPGASNDEYCRNMGEAFDRIRDAGIREIAFGDIFLEDLKMWREEFLARHELKCRFPVWGRDTTEMIAEFLELGFRTVTSCIDPRKLSREFAGREIDREFVESLPEEVDPCGENGEFHTFVFAGPNFSEPLELDRGDVVERDGFVFCDWKLKSSRAAGVLPNC